MIDKTATLMAQYERRDDSIDTRPQTLSQVLQDLMQQLPVVMQNSANGLLQTLPDQMMNKVREGLAQSTSDYQQRLRLACDEAAEKSHVLAQQLSHLQRLHRQLIWKTMTAAVITLLLLFAGGLWQSMHYTRVLEENQIEAELLKAYNSDDVTLRQGSQLCANVGSRDRRHGEQKPYLPVALR